MISIIRLGTTPGITCGSRVIDGLDNDSSESLPIVGGVKKIIMIKKINPEEYEDQGAGDMITDKKINLDDIDKEVPDEVDDMPDDELDDVDDELNDEEVSGEDEEVSDEDLDAIEAEIPPEVDDFEVDDLEDSDLDDDDFDAESDDEENDDKKSEEDKLDDYI